MFLKGICFGRHAAQNKTAVFCAFPRVNIIASCNKTDPPILLVYFHVH
jgi:hypothetical protein